MRGAGVLLLAACALTLIFLPEASLAEKGDLRSVANSKSAKSATLYVTLGKADIVDIPGDIADVLVADPSIIDVQAIQSNRLYVVGSTVGDTNMIALDAGGNVLKRVDVHVKYDLQAIQGLVNEIFPGEKIKVGAIHDQVLLTGTASNPDIAAKATNIVAHYVAELKDTKDTADALVSNMLTVKGDQQVTLQVKIVEARRNIIKELGIGTNVNTDANILGRSTTAGVAAGAGLALDKPVAAALRIVQFSGIDALGDIDTLVSALEDRDMVHVLAEPNLTAVSGEQAGFLAGGETPVPSGLDQQGNIVIEFHKFGVSLNFKPIVLSGDRISLQMNTEVSSINFDNALPAGSIKVPGFDVRRADTTVELPSGRSIMIAGLLRSETAKSMAGIPGIVKTPVLGDLISSRKFQRDETELVVIVTPYLSNSYKEKERAVVETAPHNPLAQSFADNIRRTFDVKDETLFNPDQHYGYVLE